MKPSTSSYIAKFALMNACAALLLGMGYNPPYSTLDLSSEAERAQEAVLEQGEQVAPIIQHALDRVNESNSSMNSLFSNWFSNNSTVNCTDCTKAISRLRYAQCDAKDRNGYLEQQLEAAASRNNILGALIRKPVNANSIIKPMCVHMAMENSKLAPSRYKACVPGTNQYDKNDNGKGMACLSEDYFKLVNNSFDLVSSCMKDYIGAREREDMKKLDVRAVFAMINVESSFQINAVSSTGAGGIGQFTTDAIKDVNRNELSKVRASLESNKNRMCGRVSMEFLDSMAPMTPESTNSCGRISIKDGNPIKNMLYTFAYLRKAKESMDRAIFQNKDFAKKFKLSEFDMAKVKRAMMIWSHNTGPAGTQVPTKALLKIVYRNKPVTNADAFINQLQQYMQKFPAGANRNPKRRIETSGYFPKITESLEKIEEDAGGGSCVN